MSQKSKESEGALTKTQHSADLRDYFERRKRRRTTYDKQPGCGDDAEGSDVCSSSTIPLYTSPPGLEDLIKDRHDDNDAFRLVDYSGALQTDAEQMHATERDELKSELIRRGIDSEVLSRDLSPLGMRLVRKIIKEEFKNKQGLVDEEDLIFRIAQWLNSRRFLQSVELVVKVLLELAVPEDLNDETKWDFLMILESAIKSDPMIYTETKVMTVLTDFERRLILCELWQGTYLFKILNTECGRLKNGRRRPSFSSSPGKALHSITNSTSSSSEGCVNPLEFFFRKFFRASAAVFEHLITDLGLSQAVRQNSWSLFVRGIELEASVRLMRGRNMLTSASCAVYSIAKLLDEDKSFSQIVRSLYPKYVSYGEGWFRKVSLMEESGEMGDIVTFYNQVYLPRMRKCIYSFKETVPFTPEKGRNDHNRNPLLSPFPKVMGRIALSPKITLTVSPEAPSLYRNAEGTPRRITVLGNLGSYLEQETPKPKSPKRVARKLDF